MEKEEKLELIYFFLLERTYKRFRQFTQREMNKRGFQISNEQWIVLKSAFDAPGILQKDIAETAFKDPASVTRMIDLLVQRGMVERKTMTEDRRSFGIFLTNLGEEFFEKCMPLSNEIRKFGLKGVSNKDKGTFIKVLNKVYENLE